MKTILITNNYPKTVFSLFKNRVNKEKFKLEMLEENTQENLEKNVENVDYIIASGRIKINKSIIEKATNLKMIQRTGVGLDSIDLNLVKEKKIPLYVNQGVNSQSVAEHTILLILACLRKLTTVHKKTSDGIWDKQGQGITTQELKGKTVGIIGMGSIGKKVACILNAFGAKVIYNNLFKLSDEEETNLNIKFVELDEIYKNADIISLHCPLTNETKNIINEQSIELMKNGVIIVNTARGKLINTTDLMNGIKSGKIGFAGLDVYEEEPLSEKNDILKFENVIRTPHIAGITKDSFEAMADGAIKNIELFDEGKLKEIENCKVKA